MTRDGLAEGRISIGDFNPYIACTLTDWTTIRGANGREQEGSFHLLHTLEVWFWRVLLFLGDIPSHAVSSDSSKAATLVIRRTRGDSCRCPTAILNRKASSHRTGFQQRTDARKPAECSVVIDSQITDPKAPFAQPK